MLNHMLTKLFKLFQMKKSFIKDKIRLYHCFVQMFVCLFVSVTELLRWDVQWMFQGNYNHFDPCAV